MLFSLKILTLLSMPQTPSASSLEQEVLEKAIDQVSKSISDKFTTISYVNVIDDHRRHVSKRVTDTLDSLEVPKYTFAREEVTLDVRDHFYLHESGGIAIWALPIEPRWTVSELKRQLWTLDQNISGFKRCIILVVDEFGNLRNAFDKKKGRFEAPEKLHCHIILISKGENGRSNHVLTASICPYQIFSTSPAIIRKAEDFNLDALETCPPPLKGIKATVVTIGYPPYVLIHKPDQNKEIEVARDPETGNLLGVDNDVTSFLCEGLQCGSFHLRNPMDNDFEYYLEDEQRWTGGVGEVVSGLATFRVGFYPPRTSAYLETSYTGYSYFIEQGFSIGYPRPVVSLYNVIKPFDVSSWIMITLTIAIVTLVFQIIQWCHNRIGYHKTQKRGWWEIPIQTMEAMFEYRMVNFFAPHIQSARFLRFVFILLGAFFTWAYNCNIRANLLTKEIPEPVKTFEELGERGIEYWTPKGGAQAEYITNKKDEYPFNKIYPKMIAFDYNSSLVEDEYLDSHTLFDESFATEDTKVIGLYANYPFQNNSFAARHFRQGMFPNEYSHVQMKKGAPFLNQMSTTLERMHAMGFDDYFIWKRLPIEANDWDPYADVATSEVLNLERVALAFIIWMFVIAVATITFFMEKCYPDTNFLSPCPSNG